MTIKYKALLFNLLYLLFVFICLAAAAYVRGSMLLGFSILALVLILSSSSYHHYKKRSFGRDTLIEYALTVTAVIIILLGAFHH